MEYIPIIIILVLLIIIIAAIYCGVSYLRRKSREVSRALFGTENLMEGVEKRNMELATTPKSVAAMTRLMLPRITADFPDFQYDEMKERAENVLVGYLCAINGRNSSLLPESGSELKEQLQYYLQMLDSQSKKEHFEQIKIHRTEISQYRKSDGRCIITFQSAVECLHYITDANGQVIQGDKTYKYQTRYNIDLIYVQDRDLVENERERALGMNCPNCGAPLTTLGAKVCEYCGTPVLEINIHAWTFSNVEEV